jgi:hypothetical protein
VRASGVDRDAQRVAAWLAAHADERGEGVLSDDLRDERTGHSLLAMEGAPRWARR